MSTKTKKQFQINHNIFLNPRHYRLFALGSFAFLLAFLASAILTPVSSSSAQTLQYDISTTGDFYVKVSGSKSLTLANLQGSPLGQLASLKDIINVETNAPTGYRLMLSTTSSNLVNNSDANSYLTSTTGSITTPTALALDTWGFAFNNTNTGVVENGFTEPTNYYTDTALSVPTLSATWAAVPTNPTQISANDAPNVSTAGTDLEVYYGVNASSKLAPGTYATTITYTALAEGINTFPAMQDFTQTMCDSLPTSTADEDHRTTLTDTRDYKNYKIAKLADGNCWMVQNLALDGANAAGEVRTLTPADSDVTENRKLATNSTSGTSSTEVKIYADKAADTTTSCNTSSYPYCVKSDEPYGNLYNWYAATATTGTYGMANENVPDSICPKGWKLPTSGNESSAYGANAPDKSYGKLMYAVLGFDAAGGNGNGVYVQNAQKAPLYFPLAGYFISSDYSAQGLYGYYWSRAAYSSISYAYSFLLNSNTNGNFRPQDNNNMNGGFSVRCVFDPPVIEDNMYMQDVTATMCTNLSETTAETDNRKTLIDSRDDKTYRIAKLADGNCWMVQNLALDPIDSDGNNRTLTTNDTNINTAEIPSGEYTFPDNTLIPTGAQPTNEKEQIYSDDSTNTELYGNYYNWMSATLGIGTTNMTTGEIHSSVCPKGWRLPTSGTSSAYGASAPDKSYGKLMYSVLNFTAESATGATGKPYTNSIQQSPLFFSLAGYYSTTVTTPKVVGQGHNGSYWSRTASSDTNSYALDFDSNVGNFYPQYGRGKSGGLSVRCVLGE